MSALQKRSALTGTLALAVIALRYDSVDFIITIIVKAGGIARTFSKKIKFFFCL